MSDRPRFFGRKGRAAEGVDDDGRLLRLPVVTTDGYVAQPHNFHGTRIAREVGGIRINTIEHMGSEYDETWRMDIMVGAEEVSGWLMDNPDRVPLVEKMRSAIADPSIPAARFARAI